MKWGNMITQNDKLEIFENFRTDHRLPKFKKKRDVYRSIEAGGSRKLYFVGDWVDEMCDLTLEQIVDVLGAGAVREIVTEP